MLHNTYLFSRPMCSFKLLLFTFFLTFWWTKSLLNLCVLWITLWILLCIYNYKCSITNFTFHKMVCIAMPGLPPDWDIVFTIDLLPGSLELINISHNLSNGTIRIEGIEGSIARVNWQGFCATKYFSMWCSCVACEEEGWGHAAMHWLTTVEPGDNQESITSF